ncbi:hypothetical protein ScPMuIL_006302 [Solemya velum]
MDATNSPRSPQLPPRSRASHRPTGHGCDWQPEVSTTAAQIEGQPSPDWTWMRLAARANLGQQYVLSTNQSSTYGGNTSSYGPANAVDNNFNQDVRKHHCAIQRDKQSSAWWRIEFNDKVHIDHIVIYHGYHLHDGELKRFKHSRVYVSDSAAECSGQLVYTQETDPTASRPWQDVFNISVNAVGKYLSVCQDAYPYRHDTPSSHNTSRVVLCEVIITGCPYGKYGDQCDLTCGKCDKDTCSLSDGTCPGECEEWYMGPMCDKPCGDGCTGSSCNMDGCTSGCVAGNYGAYCDMTCGNCDQAVCSAWDGKCPGQCEDQYMGPMCDKPCGDVCTGSSCIKDGCTRGKMVSVMSVTLDTDRVIVRVVPVVRQIWCVRGTCVDGFWGDWCNATCPGNCAGGVCNKSRGQCDEGCLPGHWGPECRHECSVKCASSLCHRDDGNCTAGCTVGFYSNTCIKRCGHCVGDVCDQHTGTCDDGCVKGYWGGTCEDTCPDTCREQNCDGSTGVCNARCQNGFWGVFCNITCSDNDDGDDLVKRMGPISRNNTAVEEVETDGYTELSSTRDGDNT